MKHSSVLRIGASLVATILAVSTGYSQEPHGAVKRLTPQLQPPPPQPVQRQQIPPRQVNPAVNPAPAPAVQPAPAPVQQRAAPATEQRIRELITVLATPNPKDNTQALAATVELVEIGPPALPFLEAAKQSGDGRLMGQAIHISNMIQNPRVGERQVAAYKRLLQDRGVAVPQAAAPPRPVVPELALDPAALPQQAAEPAAPAGPTLDLLETIGFKIVATPTGLVIAELRADSPASRVGFAVGDLMLTVNHKVLLGLDDAKQAFGAAKEGDVFGIEAARGAEKFKLALPIPKPGAW